jgi:hypothetical protein
MTLSTRVWRQPVYRDRFLAAHTLFLLLNNRLSNSESMRAQVGHGLALQGQDSDEVVRPSHGSPRGMWWRQGRSDQE